MGYVYKYIDKSDNIVKYVGIVWKGSLEQRINSHRYDYWFRGKNWEIKYIITPNESRTDTEYMEAHFISYYESYKYYNEAKNNWGVSKFIPEYKEEDWILYDSPDIEINPSKTIFDLENELIEYKEKYYKLSKEYNVLKEEYELLKNNFEYEVEKRLNYLEAGQKIIDRLNKNSINSTNIKKEKTTHKSRRKNGQGCFGVKKINGSEYNYFKAPDGKFFYAKNMEELYIKITDNGYKVFMP